MSGDTRRTFLGILKEQTWSTSSKGIGQIGLWNIISVLNESLWRMWTPTDQFIVLTGLTATWEKSCKKVNTSSSIASLWWLLFSNTWIYSCATAVAVPSRMRNRMVRRCKLQSRSICQHSECLGGKMQNHLFFFHPSFFAVFTPDRGWSLSRFRSLDSRCHNWLRSTSSLRPVDSRVAAGQPIMKWPWSGVSRAIELLKQ